MWARLDPTRTRAPAGAEPGLEAPGSDPDVLDPRAEWTRYALDAEVMCVRRSGSRRWTAPAGLTFRDWLRGAGEHRPTPDDLAYHLSTLFPPVRPRGHLELRMIDAQPADGWIVPAGLVAALLDDPVAADLAMAAADPVWHGRVPDGQVAERAAPLAAARARGWTRPGSARLTPCSRRAGRACFEAAEAALGRSRAPRAVRDAVAAFADKYASRGRCPADDMLREVSR